MLTSMKLSGNIEDITAYHCREENYYFKQGNDLVDELAEVGIKARSDQRLGYVMVRGRMCERLGFKDGQSISEIDFDNLLSGRNKDGLVVSRKHKCHGIDLTFSPPKSASIAALVLGEKVIVELHRQAVTETMREIEKLTYGRVTSKSRDHTGKMIWVEVQDGFSREKDPHLHTHCIVMNLTEVDGKIVALDGREIMKRDFNQVFGAVYRQKMAQALHHDYGYEIDYTKSGEWRLRKIPQGLEEEFSKRRRQILEAEATGLRDMDAWRKTRKDKDNKVSTGTCRAEWLKRLDAWRKKFGWETKVTGEVWRKEWATKAVYNVEAEQERKGERGAKTTKSKKWQLALRRATTSEATVTKEALIHQYLCEVMRDETWRSKSYERALFELEEEVKKGHILEINGYYTSWEMVRAEREYLAVANNDETTSLYFDAPDKYIDAFNSNSKRKLSNVQRKAAEAILKSRERVVVVQGDAGSGKTTALKAVADAYKSQGISVIGLAMQGVAAQNLEKETGVASTTLKSFFSPARANSGLNRVLLVDEASMLDSRTAAKLFKIARSNGDKVILVGDRNQLESIGAGRVFERLVEIKERRGELICLNENFRQRDPDLREAVDLARKGSMRASLEILERRGDIVEIENRFVKGENVGKERHEVVAEHYSEDTLLICSTVSTRDELNELVRQNLKLDGYLKKEAQYTLARADEDGIDQERKLQLAVGDKIVFTKNEYKEYDVRNGERATVIKLGGILKPHHITVETEDKRKLEIDTRKYKHIDYGYALTTYKAQGQTYSKVVVDADTSAGPALNDMRNQYVNITRARDSVKIYTDDKDALKDLAGMLEHKRDTLDKLDITLEAAINEEKKLAEKILNDVMGRGVPLSDEKERDIGFGDTLKSGAGRARTLER